MTFRSRSQRAAIALLGAATIAVGLPALVAGSANAAGPGLRLTGPTSASAGTCALTLLAAERPVGWPT